MGDVKTLGRGWVAPEGEPSFPTMVTVGREAIATVRKGNEVSLWLVLVARWGGGGLDCEVGDVQIWRA